MTKQTRPTREVKIVKQDNFAFTHSSVGCYLFEVTGSYQLAATSIMPFYLRSRVLMPIVMQGFSIIPWGETNTYPETIRTILDDNNLTPEVLTKTSQLLYGQGPGLYRMEHTDGKRHKTWVNDAAIEAWLATWDWEEYLLKCCIEFRTINGHFTKYFRNKGARVGNGLQIAKLEHVSSVFARMEWPDNNWKVNNIITGEFSAPWRIGLNTYPVFDPGDPFRYPVSMRYSNLYSYALDHEYSRSPFHGTMNWITLSSSIPKLLLNFNMNSAAIKYHIKSPAVYWEQKRTKLIEQCADTGILYTEKMLDDLKDATYVKITEALSGGDNAGKMVTTEELFDDNANVYSGWKIDVLDQKVGDFINAQIAIAERAAFETTSGIGLHPALSNLSRDGNLPSGSEQLYAFKLYLSTGIDIPESIVTKDINYALRANFPGTDLKVGFYHDNILTEEATTPADRMKNQSSYKDNQLKPDKTVKP